MDVNLQRAEARLDALAWYQASVLDDDPAGACAVAEGAGRDNLIVGLTSLLDIVISSWATPLGVSRTQAVDLLRAANLAICGVTE
jgi:hypothetical protein